MEKNSKKINLGKTGMSLLLLIYVVILAVFFIGGSDRSFTNLLYCAGGAFMFTIAVAISLLIVSPIVAGLMVGVTKVFKKYFSWLRS